MSLTTRNARGVFVPSAEGSKDGLRDNSSIGLIRSSTGEVACRRGTGISYSLAADGFRIESPNLSSGRLAAPGPTDPIGDCDVVVRSVVEGLLVDIALSAKGDRLSADPVRDSSSDGLDRLLGKEDSLGVPSYRELCALAMDVEDPERVVL